MTLRHALLHAISGERRHVIALRGPDTVRFVQGTVSADVERIAEGKSAPAGLLTVKGKLVSEVIVLPAEGDGLDLLVPEALAREVAELLEKHIIMDEVEVRGPSEIGLALVWDDERDGLPDDAGPNPEGSEALVRFETRHPAPGWLWMGPVDAIERAFASSDPHAFEVHRVRSGSPGWGRELGPGFFPPEVGFVYAVSYDKGCYLGQEPLARLHARGQVNRAMVRVTSSRGVSTPTDLAAPDRPNAGQLTTLVETPQGWRGLAIVRREVARAGTVLHLADDPQARVEITSDVLGGDPGIGGRVRA